METSEHYFLLEDVLFHKKKKKKPAPMKSFKKNFHFRFLCRVSYEEIIRTANQSTSPSFG